MHACKQNERYIKENLDRKGQEQCNMLMRINTVTSSIKHLVPFFASTYVVQPSILAVLLQNFGIVYTINALCGWQSQVLFTFSLFLLRPKHVRAMIMRNLIGKDVVSKWKHQSTNKIADWRSPEAEFIGRCCLATNNKVQILFSCLSFISTSLFTFNLSLCCNTFLIPIENAPV